MFWIKAEKWEEKAIGIVFTDNKNNNNDNKNDKR